MITIISLIAISAALLLVYILRYVERRSYKKRIDDLLVRQWYLEKDNDTKEMEITRLRDYILDIGDKEKNDG